MKVGVTDEVIALLALRIIEKVEVCEIEPVLLVCLKTLNTGVAIAEMARLNDFKVVIVKVGVTDDKICLAEDLKT